MAISTNGYSRQRITSLYSGMDTESLVKNALTGHQTKVDNAYRQKVKTSWKLEAYTSVNKQVASLKNSYFDILTSGSLLASASYNKFKVSATGGTGVSVTATSSASAANFTIMAATMAKNASISGTGNVRSASDVTSLRADSSSVNGLRVGGAAITGDTTVAELADTFGLGDEENLSFSINGETFTFEQSASMNDIMTAVNDSSIANVTMSLDATGKFSIASDSSGKASKFTTANITGTFFSTLNKTYKASATSASGVALNDVAITGETSIAELATRFGLAEGEELSFTINGETFTFAQTDTINDVINEVNESAGANVTMSLSEDGKFSIASDTTGIMSNFTMSNVTGSFFSTAENTGIGIGEGTVNPEVKGIGIKAGTTSAGIMRSDSIAEALLKQGASLSGYADGKMNVTVNGKDFTFDIYSDTISSMMSEINKDASLGATFSYSELTDKFEITSNVTGSAAELNITGFDALLKNNTTSAQGADATMTIQDDNGQYSITQSSNTFTLDGMKFEITSEFDASVDSTKAINVGLTRDASGTVELVKKFIEDYNEMVESLNTLYNERADRKYSPLTDEEEDSVTEKQAEDLTAKAKAGILGNDSNLGSLLSSLRSSLMVKVGDTGYSAMDLGISTVAWDSSSWKTNQGKLQLDEDRLTTMLEQNPGVVQQVLSGVGTKADGSLDTDVTRTADGLNTTSKSGLFTRMNAYVNTFTNKMRTVLTDTAEDVTDLATKVDDLTAKMYDYEETLWAKYSNMETLLSKLQSQTDSLSALFTTSK